MKIQRHKLDADVITAVNAIRDLLPKVEVESAVRDVIASVKQNGDRALLEYTQKFDINGLVPKALAVDPAELTNALNGIDNDVRAALELALENVTTVAKREISAPELIKFPQGHSVTMRDVPVKRAGVYAPSGHYPYPSTVIMGAGTARGAGVDKVAVCTPPKYNGDIHPVILAACALCEVDVVYRVGGAQSIAALAFGTETIDPVDVIAGPGNYYVQEAKRQVFGQVGIDSVAGPSDLIVLFSEGADPRLIALDLLSQGEHGEDTLVIALSPSAQALEAVAAEINTIGRNFENTNDAIYALVKSQDIEQALEFSEQFAPEHLELIGEDAQKLAPRIRQAGCLLVGPGSAAAFSDYVAGSNHVLPTLGCARFASSLSARHFRRRMPQVEIGWESAAHLAPAGICLAEAEGFQVHAESMRARGVKVES